MKVSMADRYLYEQQHIGFFYNSDPDCLEKHGKGPIAYFNQENLQQPTVYDYADSDNDFSTLLVLLNKLVVKGTPRWGQRSFQAITNQENDAIIYLVD